MDFDSRERMRLSFDVMHFAGTDFFCTGVFIRESTRLLTSTALLFTRTEIEARSAAMLLFPPEVTQ